MPVGRTSLGRMTLRKRGLAADQYCSKWLQRCRILGFFGDEFHNCKENLHFRGSNLSELGARVSVDKNYTFFLADVLVASSS